MDKRKTIISLFCMLSFSSSLFATPVVEKKWEISSGVAQPESVAYDAKSGMVFVSNIDGAPNQKDGKGFISLIDLDGNMKKLDWVSGLNAPKGMVSHRGNLYVSDIDELVVISIVEATVISKLHAASSIFLNDVTIDEKGIIYVSDMLANTIWRLKKSNFDVWVAGDALDYPNGLFAEKKRIVFGSWGKPKEDFSTDVAGHLKEISLSNKKVKSLGAGNPIGNLDGVEADGSGGYWMTDWVAGKLLHMDKSGKVELILDMEPGSADLLVLPEQNLIIIPEMNQNKISAYTIKR